MTYFPPEVFRSILAYIPTTKPAREHNKKIADVIKDLAWQSYNRTRACFNDPEIPFSKVSYRMGRRYARQMGVQQSDGEWSYTSIIHLDRRKDGTFRAHSQLWKNAVVKIVEANCFIGGRLCLPSPLYDEPIVTRIMDFCKWYEANILRTQPRWSCLLTYDRYGEPLLWGMSVFKTKVNMNAFCKNNGIKGYAKIKKKELAYLIMKWGEPYVSPYIKKIIGVECSQCNQAPFGSNYSGQCVNYLHGDCAYCGKENTICFKYSK